MAIREETWRNKRLQASPRTYAASYQFQEPVQTFWQSGKSNGTSASQTRLNPVPQENSGGGKGTYTPGEAVNQAKEQLQSVLNSQPAPYQSRYSGQIASLYDQIMNRPGFTYDVNKDPLFRQYKTQYTLSGQRAMEDTVGNAAALTGGYGNSWGTTVGFQAYQSYLQRLNDLIPELEGRAYNRYQDEGTALQKKLNLVSSLESADYSGYQNALSNWQKSLSAAENAYNEAYEADLSAWEDGQENGGSGSWIQNGWGQNGLIQASEPGTNGRSTAIRRTYDMNGQSLAGSSLQTVRAANQAQSPSGFDGQLRQYEETLARVLYGGNHAVSNG